MTALAFTLVIALLTVMMAFVNGMYRLTEATGQPGNVIVLSDGATDEVVQQPDSRSTSPTSRISPASSATMRPPAGQPRDLPGRQPADSRSAAGPAETRRFLQVRGIETPQMAAAVHGLSLHAGRHSGSPRPACRTCPIGAAAGRREPPGGPPIQAVARRRRSLGEMGRRRSRRPTIGRRRNPAAARRRRHFRSTTRLDRRRRHAIGRLDVRFRNLGQERPDRARCSARRPTPRWSSAPTDAASGLRLKDLLHQRSTRRPPYRPRSRPNITPAWATPTGSSSSPSPSSPVVMAVGGMFGVMNTMFAAISQRTKDIGVLRLLGYTRRQMLVSFLLESLVIALVGGGWAARSARWSTAGPPPASSAAGRAAASSSSCRLVGRRPNRRHRHAPDPRHGRLRRSRPRPLRRAAEAAGIAAVGSTPADVYHSTR